MKIKFTDANESLVAVKADGTEVDILSKLDFVYKCLVGKRVVAKIDVTSTSLATNILGSASGICGVIIDDVVQPSVVDSYIFSTTGEHTIQYILKNDTSIGNSAFWDCSGLTSITIPNSVTSIGEYAFQSCSGLTSVTIPNSVTSIGSSAFNGCSGLTSITIPNSVTSIEERAFSYCTGLTSIVVESGNNKYDSRNNCNAIIETSSNKLIVGCKNTVIPNNVTSIESRAFNGCSGLTSVTIPNSVTSIGNSAFYGCSGLTSIICNATTAPTISSITFYNVKTGGTLTVPTGSTGYDVWMGTGNYYLGKYNWTKVEQ